MPSLQIRDLPEHLYRILADRARRNRRSLAQQATIELERMTEAARRSRRLGDTALDPVDAIRQDRDR